MHLALAHEISRSRIVSTHRLIRFSTGTEKALSMRSARWISSLRQDNRAATLYKLKHFRSSFRAQSTRSEAVGLRLSSFPFLQHRGSMGVLLSCSLRSVSKRTGLSSEQTKPKGSNRGDFNIRRSEDNRAVSGSDLIVFQASWTAEQ